MKHIRQIGANPYTIVVTTDWNDILENHQSIIEHPELFEISDDEIPNECQYLNYQ